MGLKCLVLQGLKCSVLQGLKCSVLQWFEIFSFTKLKCSVLQVLKRSFFIDRHFSMFDNNFIFSVFQSFILFGFTRGSPLLCFVTFIFSNFQYSCHSFSVFQDSCHSFSFPRFLLYSSFSFPRFIP